MRYGINNKKQSLIRLFSVALVGFLLTTHVCVVVSAQGDPLLVQPPIASFSLTTEQQDRKAITITNPSTDTIQFSIIKEGISSSDSFDPLGSASGSLEEVGSPWVTSQFDFARTGYNSIESALPPYEKKWRFQSTKPILSPVLSGNNLYVPSEDGNVYLIHSRTGVKEDQFYSGQSIYSIHLYQRYLLITTDTALVLFDRVSEQQIWSAPFVIPNPYGIAVWEGLVFVGLPSRLVCMDLITGETQWTVQGKCTEITAADGVVIAILNQNEMYIAHSRSGEKIFHQPMDDSISGPVVYSDQQLFYCTSDVNHQQSTLYCSSLQGEIYWSYPQDDFVNTCPSVSDDTIFITTGKGMIKAIQRVTGKKIWQQPMNTPVLVPPVIAAGLVFVGGNNGKVCAYHVKNGSIVWQTQLSFPINAPIVIAQGFLYIVDNTGNMWSFCREGENVIPPYTPARVKGYPGNQRFTLTWTIEQPSPDLIGYHIYRQKEWESDFSFYDTVGLVNNYEDLHVINGKKYKYVLRAFDTFGNESNNSNMVAGIPTQESDPSWLDYTPTGGSLAPGESTVITISAQASLTPPGTHHAQLVFIQSGLTYLQEYSTLQVILTTQKSSPDAIQPPTLLQAIGSDTRAIIQWKKYPGIWNYELYRSTVSHDEMKRIGTFHAEQTQHTDDTVRNGKTYYYTMKALAQDGKTSSYSNELFVTPNPLPLLVNKDTSITVFNPVFPLDGRADPKAILTINDKVIDKNAEGFFNTSVGVPVGVHDLIIKAKALDQTEQIVKVQVNCFLNSLQIRLGIDQSEVYVNDLLWPWLLEAKPLIRDDRTFVPLRFISEVVGGDVQWNPQEKSIQVLYKQNEVVLWIGSKEILVNGKKERMDTAPFLYNNRTLVPLRFVTEPLGATIKWESSTQTILLSFQFT